MNVSGSVHTYQYYEHATYGDRPCLGTSLKWHGFMFLIQVFSEGRTDRRTDFSQRYETSFASAAVFRNGSGWVT